MKICVVGSGSGIVTCKHTKKGEADSCIFAAFSCEGA
jgi:hypothetical protein